MKIGLSFVAALLFVFAMSSCKDCKDCNTVTITYLDGFPIDTATAIEEFCNKNLENVEDLTAAAPARDTVHSTPGMITTRSYDCP